MVTYSAHVSVIWLVIDIGCALSPANCLALWCCHSAYCCLLRVSAWRTLSSIVYMLWHPGQYLSGASFWQKALHSTNICCHALALHVLQTLPQTCSMMTSHAVMEAICVLWLLAVFLVHLLSLNWLYDDSVLLWCPHSCVMTLTVYDTVYVPIA